MRSFAHPPASCSRVLVVIGALMALAGVAFAQPGRFAAKAPPDPRTLFIWSTDVVPEAAPPGETVVLTATLTIAPDHYVYKDETALVLESAGALPPFLTAESFTAPLAKARYDKFLDKTTLVYTDAVTLGVPVHIAPDAPEGTHTVRLIASTQGCSQKICYLKMRTPLTATITIGEKSSRFVWPSLGSLAGGGGAGEVESLVRAGSVMALAVIFIGGFLTSLTPCVYPLIPVTISICGVQEGTSKFSGFTLALAYVLGMAVMYTVLGVSAALTGAIFGQVLANPVVVTVVAIMFAAFGISALGGYDMRLPRALEQRLMKVGGAGYAGAFAMGLVGGVIAAPCTGPVLGGVLTYVATSRDALWGGSLLFTFAMGMGVLFLVIGTFSQFATRLPRSGPWMESIKSIFGIVMLGMALFFLPPAFPAIADAFANLPSTKLWAVAMLAAAAVGGGVHLSFYDPAPITKIRKGLGVLIGAFGILVLMNNVTLPLVADAQANDAGADSIPANFVERVPWMTDEAEGLARARAEQKPVIIDFWADWCVACKELDAYTYNEPRVAARLEEFVPIKLNYTEGTPDGDRLKSKYLIVGLPTVVFLDSNGDEVPGSRLTGFIGPDAFLEHINNIE